jgi:serine protease Do
MEEKKRHFGRTVLLVVLAAALGGGTLGAGYGAGTAAANHFLPDKAIASEEQPSNYQMMAETGVIPINVQVSDFSGIVKQVSESVVSINVTAIAYNSLFRQSYPTEGAGSGIIFKVEDDKVFIATNNHVVENVESITISLDDNEQVEAKLIGLNPQSDLAVLSVNKADLDALGVPYRAATFGDSDAMEVGAQVVAIGNSMGEGQIATSGIISAINKQITIEGKTLDVLQTDAAINPGNSGGPLVNIAGEVIGINTAKLFAANAEGMGYSIPTNAALATLEELRVTGTVAKPYLGILEPRTIDESIKELFNLPSTGVLVSSVDESSNAYAAGLQMRDLVVGFNGTEITSVADLQEALAACKVGDEVTLTVYRGGDQHIIKVVLGNANDR